MELTDLDNIKNRIINGGQITDNEALALLDVPDEKLWEAAAEITAALTPREFDSCSIVNARSGLCGEDCKWCAQSARYATGCDRYDIIDRDECLEAARYNHSRGVRRFSLVASGRKASGRFFDDICNIAREIIDSVGIKTCASLGLIGRDEMHRLRLSGVTRYHCNLESAPSHFKSLCTTHTVDDKLTTIGYAHEEGLEVCSGGIIGMGETSRQRVEFALTLRKAKPVSIPVNILCPIPGTPLENARPLTEEEILTAVAVMRFVHPKAVIRFAGGRTKLSREGQLKAMKIGVNGAITGDMLTTTGTTIASDRELASDASLSW